MQRYFLHLDNSAGYVPDEEGPELASLAGSGTVLAVVPIAEAIELLLSGGWS